MGISSIVGTFGIWDYVVFALMLIISAAIGIYYAIFDRGEKTTKDFLIGGRRMTAVPVSLSLTASFMSAVTVLGTPSEVYRYGAMFGVFAFSFLLVVIVCSEVFLPVFYRLGITSTYEYLEMRFNTVVRLCGTAMFIFLTVLYTGVVIYAPALALNQVTGFDLWGAVVSTGIVCTFYCTMGGLKAVVWTDVFQVGIMFAGFLSVITRSMVVQNGFSAIINDSYHGGRLNIWDFDPNPLRRQTFWTIILGGTFTWMGVYGVNQAQVQRYISCKSMFHAKMSLYLNLVGLWVILFCSVFSGLCLYSIYKDCDPWTSQIISAPDQLMPYLVLDILRDYPGVPGLFVASAYSGTLSTVSSSINALATVTVEDLVKPYFKMSDRKLSWTSKGLNLLYGALCIGVAGMASLMDSLIQAVLSIFGVVGGPLLGLFALGILFPCANATGSLVGLVCGLCLTLWVGIGAQLYPQLPEKAMSLSLSTANCNFSFITQAFNKTFPTQLPLLTTAVQDLAAYRPYLADNLYSLSFMYFSTIGTLSVMAVGVTVSLLTGGRKQNLVPGLTLTKEDLTFYHMYCFFKPKDRHEELLDCGVNPKKACGTLNPTFSDGEVDTMEENTGKNNLTFSHDKRS
ncbi:sodium-coupled monocarboxylate transporter 1 [Amia ocellicauda]|uniref:sodium-coupled monocarboxylate transporter 1 n=1 Tax=Amia ocellicauda TaxID=2972642 RepID=UPI0034639CBC